MKRKLLAALLCLPLLAGCSSISLKTDTVEMELGDDVFANPRLYVNDGQSIDVNDAEVYTTTPGVMKTRNRFVTSGQNYLEIGEYEFFLDYKGKTYPFALKINDTKPPTCTRAPEVAEVNGYMPVDWDEVFGARDLSGVYYECEALTNGIPIQGPVEVKISDRFGNSVTRTVTLNPFY